MSHSEPTPALNCIRCAHAWARSRDGLVGSCPARDLTGRTMLCPRSDGRSWLPLGYLAMLDQWITPDEAQRRAIAILLLSPRQQLENAMGTTIAKQQEKFGGLLDTIEQAATDYSLALSSDQIKGMRLTLAKATAVATIESALTDELLKTSVLPLMGKKFGFRTDRDLETKPYPLSTVRSCVCEVLLGGGRIDGNEFNIIAGTAYFTKEFWQRKVEELPDVSAVTIKMGEVEIKQRKGFSRDAQDAYVEVIARWRVKRTEQQWKKTIERSDGREFDNRVVVPMNNRMGRDAVVVDRRGDDRNEHHHAGPHTGADQPRGERPADRRGVGSRRRTGPDRGSPGRGRRAGPAQGGVHQPAWRSPRYQRCGRRDQIGGRRHVAAAGHARGDQGGRTAEVAAVERRVKRLSQPHEWRERWFTSTHNANVLAWWSSPLYGLASQVVGPIMLSQKAGETGRMCGSGCHGLPDTRSPAPGNRRRVFPLTSECDL